MKILFVCSSNLERSPTFEEYFRKTWPHHEYASAGCYHGFPKLVGNKTLKWADIVYVMDMSHHRFIKNKFPKFIHKVQIVGISDQYERGSAGLIEMIQYWTDNFGYTPATIQPSLGIGYLQTTKVKR